MRVATWCERCGAAVPESGVWIVRSGVRIYCAGCGFLSPPAVVVGDEREVAKVIDLRHPALQHPALSGPRRPA